MDEVLAQIAHWVDRQERHYVSVCNVHTVIECQHDVAMQKAVNGATIATPDGMPLVWLGRAKSECNVSRVYGPDLMLALCSLSAQNGYSHYFYGGAEGTPQRLAGNLIALYPGLQIAGGYSPPFRPLSAEEDARIIAEINAAKPDILWVGLGTPKQDLWMAAHRDQLTAPVLIAVGAAFDFHTGRKSQAPLWMQRNGLEWFYRLLSEPRRLWRRYLLYNPLFVALVLLQELGLRRYTLEE
jgi:N-acetylglucosaminyldiphosphoundecaprenol N-acetyl-beta-D-mannosaminyltransferase